MNKEQLVEYRIRKLQEVGRKTNTALLAHVEDRIGGCTIKDCLVCLENKLVIEELRGRLEHE